MSRKWVEGGLLRVPVRQDDYIVLCGSELDRKKETLEWAGVW